MGYLCSPVCSVVISHMTVATSHLLPSLTCDVGILTCYGLCRQLLASRQRPQGSLEQAKIPPSHCLRFPLQSDSLQERSVLTPAVLGHGCSFRSYIPSVAIEETKGWCPCHNVRLWEASLPNVPFNYSQISLHGQGCRNLQE